MELGAFSVSLAVKNIRKSLSFYENLGFHQMGGDIEQNWIILKNGSTVIGLFQGMFDRNLLTFNPGWDQDAENLASFTDIRELKRALEDRGLTPENVTDETGSGPASFMLTDPDGNPILLDQHR